MRKGTWGEVAKVSGIECVGEVSEDPSGKLSRGQKVAALMGGLGRTINGSYAEFTCVPATNVVPLQPGHTIFVRGGTSALGQAAINIAVNAGGTTVVASTRKRERVDFLKALGATEVLIEEPVLKETMRHLYPDGIDGVLDLIGNSTLLDSLGMVRKSGHVCNAGFLGGRDPISFDPLSQMPVGVNLNFFGSFVYGSNNFPVSAVPLQEIVDKVGDGTYKAKPVQVFEFIDIVKAHELMEVNASCGKIVVRV